MTLWQMSFLYAENASVLSARIAQLRAQASGQTDEEIILALHRRIAALTPLYREARELARFTAHYYDDKRSTTP